MKQSLFKIAAAIYGLVILGVCLIWVASYSYPPIATNPESGESPIAPPHPIIWPEPSDAAEYIVIFRGDIERWEYADWEKKWYRLSNAGHVPILAILATLLVVPAVWVVVEILSNKIEKPGKKSED